MVAILQNEKPILANKQMLVKTSWISMATRRNCDQRSSYALEDVATEFDIQGLELDWVGMCWDANFRREDNRWKPYYFRGSRWERVQDPTRAAYLANAYRVLLTRARQGMVILARRAGPNWIKRDRLPSMTRRSPF
jgi:DUF2075 family protein